MSLKLVRSLGESDFDAGEISPILSEVPIHYSNRPKNGVHQFDFGVELDGQELAESVSLDHSTLSDEFQNFSHVRTLRAIRAGLRTLTYPNSRIMRHAGYADSNAKQTLRESRQDILGIISSIDQPEHHRMVPANLTLYSDLTGNFEVDAVIDDALRDLKPQALKDFCEHYGVTVDETALQRHKGSNREGYINATDFVNDANKLKENYKQHRFKRAIVLPDEDETVLTDAKEWPDDKWSEKASAIQLLSALPALKRDSLGVRWKVLIRDDSAPRHIVRPRLLIQTHTSKQKDEMVVNPNLKNGMYNPIARLVFELQPPVYDRSSHTVTHYSSILGAVMLVKASNPDALNGVLEDVIEGKNRSRKHISLPDKALGLAPLLIQNHEVQRETLASNVCMRLMQHVEATLKS